MRAEPRREATRFRARAIERASSLVTWSERYRSPGSRLAEHGEKVDSREAARSEGGNEEEKEPNPFSPRERVRPTFRLCADRVSRGTGRPRRSTARSLARPLRGRKEEVQMRENERRTRGQKEGQTGRPERGTRGCHGYRRIPASPRCHGDGGGGHPVPLSCTSRLFPPSRFLCPRSLARTHAGSLARSRNSVPLALARANLLSATTWRLARSLALPRPSFGGGNRAATSGEREVERERAREKTDARGRMRDTWVLRGSETSQMPPLSLCLSSDQLDRLSIAESLATS